MQQRPDRRSRRGSARTRSRPAGSPPATRPAARRSGGASGAASRTSAPRQRGRFTARAIVLGVVLVALGLSYVFPLRVYLGQQAEIAELRSSQERQRDRIDELAAEAALWADDEYVRIQARERLSFGEPGEVLLIPVWEEEVPQPEPGVEAAPPPVGPWWETLWASVESANGVGGDGADPEGTGAG